MIRLYIYMSNEKLKFCLSSRRIKKGLKSKGNEGALWFCYDVVGCIKATHLHCFVYVHKQRESSHFCLFTLLQFGLGPLHCGIPRDLILLLACPWWKHFIDITILSKKRRKNLPVRIISTICSSLSIFFLDARKPRSIRILK